VLAFSAGAASEDRLSIWLRNSRIVEPAKFEPFLAALVTVRAQRLQLAIPEFDRIVVMRLDMVRDKCRDDLAFAQAHRTKRLVLKLTARPALPRGFVVQPAHSTKSPLLIAPHILSACDFPIWNSTAQNVVSITNDIFSAAMHRLTNTPVLKSRQSPGAATQQTMSERGDIWLSRGFSVTCILSAFIGALMVGMLLGEPDVLMLFGAVGGVMVGAVFYFVVAGVIRRLF
jgi:hypothetical protein